MFNESFIKSLKISLKVEKFGIFIEDWKFEWKFESIKRSLKVSIKVSTFHWKFQSFNESMKVVMNVGMLKVSSFNKNLADSMKVWKS